jgi:hypothetical protein
MSTSEYVLRSSQVQLVSSDIFIMDRFFVPPTYGTTCRFLKNWRWSWFSTVRDKSSYLLIESLSSLIHLHKGYIQKLIPWSPLQDVYSYLSFARISSTRLTLPSLPVPAAISRSVRVPIRISVAIRGAPCAWTAAWQSWMAFDTWDQGPSVRMVRRRNLLVKYNVVLPKLVPYPLGK